MATALDHGMLLSIEDVARLVPFNGNTTRLHACVTALTKADSLANTRTELNRCLAEAAKLADEDPLLQLLALLARFSAQLDGWQNRTTHAETPEPLTRESEPTAMNAHEFAALSAELVASLRKWIEEASKDEGLSAADLALVQQTLRTIERVTYREVAIKPDTAN